MIWNEAVELERLVFGGTNAEIAQRLITETKVALMYLVPQDLTPSVGGESIDPEPPTDDEWDSLSQLLHKADKELGQ